MKEWSRRDPPSTCRRRSDRVLAWARLVRLPNHFSAIADVLLGWFVVGHQHGTLLELAGLITISWLLYAAGMIWNDVFDLEVDRQERPFRPLPSGQISTRAAETVASLCMALATLIAFAISNTTGATTLLLIFLIMLYDGVLKATPLGPWVMGSCRSVNVLIGAAGISTAIGIAALANGVYIAGVTMLARHETLGITARKLVAPGIIITFGLWIHLLNWPRLAGVVLLPFVALYVLHAMNVIKHDPHPLKIMFIIKFFLMGLIAINAFAALTLTGNPAALLILLFYLPAILLARRVYVT